MVPGPLPPGVPIGAVGFLSFYPEKPGVKNGGLMVEANFPSRPWNEYHQVWLLSGGDHDPTDVPTSHPFFQNLLAKFRTPASAVSGPCRVSFSVPDLAIAITPTTSQGSRTARDVSVARD